MRAFIVLPTYNEAENVVPLARSIAQAVPDATILIVDDNSPDGTGRIAEDLRKELPQIEVKHRPGKLGLGTAYLAGFAHALAQGADCVVTMDADFSHGPECLPAMLAAAENAGLVIGSRYTRGGGSVNFAVHRKLLSRGANLLAKTLLGLTPKDCTSGFRCYRRETLEALDLDGFYANGYAFLMEMLFRVEQRGITVAESPIVYVSRVRGLSKVSRHEIINAFRTLFRLTRERRARGARP